MKLSTRARYGARALVELAAAYPGTTVSVRDVARKQGISAKYLEQILAALKAGGILRAVRGMHGGYELARPPADISLGEALAVLEGPPAPVDCVEHPETCPMRPVCPTRDTWVAIADAIEHILSCTTLADLVERQRRKAAGGKAPMYHI